MSEDIIQLNAEAVRCELKNLVKSSIEETLNASDPFFCGRFGRARDVLPLPERPLWYIIIIGK